MRGREEEKASERERGTRLLSSPGPFISPPLTLSPAHTHIHTHTRAHKKKCRPLPRQPSFRLPTGPGSRAGVAAAEMMERYKSTVSLDATVSARRTDTLSPLSDTHKHVLSLTRAQGNRRAERSGDRDAGKETAFLTSLGPSVHGFQLKSVETQPLYVLLVSFYVSQTYMDLCVQKTLRHK